MTKEQKQDWTVKMNEACDALLEVCNKIESDFLYNEVARLRHMAESVISYEFEREGNNEKG